MKTEEQVRTYEFYPGDKIIIGGKFVDLEDHLEIVAELERKIQILESKASQFESTIKETMKKSNERCKKLQEALQFYASDIEVGHLPHIGTVTISGTKARQALKDDEAMG